jgi:hypothetical protein
MMRSLLAAASAQTLHVGPMFCTGILSAADLPCTFVPQRFHHGSSIRSWCGYRFIRVQLLTLDGEQIMFFWRWSTPERRPLVSGLFGAICLIAGGSVFGAENTSNGVYTGTRLRTKGPDPQCPAEESVSVTIQSTMMLFTNSILHSFVLELVPNLDGSFEQTYISAGGQYIFIRGRIMGNVIEADVDNEPCGHHWRVKKGY